MAEAWEGARRFQAAIRKAPDDLKKIVADELRETVNAVHAKGRANLAAMVTPRSGALERNYRKSLSKKTLTGRVGYLSAKAKRAAFYARFINDGTRKMAARPFHTNAVESEKEQHQRRMLRARDTVLREIARR